MSERGPGNVNDVRFYAVEVEYSATVTHLIAVPATDVGAHKDHQAYLDHVIKGMTDDRTTFDAPMNYSGVPVKMRMQAGLNRITPLVPDSSLTSQLKLSNPFSSNPSSSPSGGGAGEGE